MSTNRKLRVFLCHASQDKPIVRELYQRLLAEGWIDPWLDEEKLLPGQDWDMEIEKAVESADAVIVCLSNNSVTKEGYVQKELRFVLDIALEKPEGTIFVIPLRLDDCLVPRRLKNWHRADYFPVEFRGIAFTRVLASLKEKTKILEASQDEQYRTSDFQYIRLDPNTKMKAYMQQDTFDGYRVSLKYRVLNSDGSNKVASILHFEVTRPVGEIISELLRLRKVEKNVQYEVEVKVPYDAKVSGILIEKGSEILLRPIS
jgi:hypothetical protein